MEVYKFGGASINSLERIRNLTEILKISGEKKIIVISALGKTTNELEAVVNAFCYKTNEEALRLFEVIKNNHLNILKALVTKNLNSAKEQLGNFFTEVEWLLHDKPVREYSYYYDQIVCIGEFLSSSIVSAFFTEEGIDNTWLDVRDIIRTDDNFQSAKIDWAFTTNMVESVMLPAFENNKLVITQGFIGCTDENESTTLGREGSDFTAAVFANIIDASSLTIWKDVQGIMNADPKEFGDAEFIPALSYNEVIEMAFYGAQVIHPDTIKPVENKNIPLYVKCFLHPNSPGTVITKDQVHHLPPIKVIKHKQVLLQLSTTDFSFVGEKPIARLYELFGDLNIRPNLLHTTAICILCCLDDIPEKIESIALSASELFEVQIERDLELLTIRHYTKEIIEELILSKTILMEQKTPQTMQVLMRSS